MLTAEKYSLFVQRQMNMDKNKFNSKLYSSSYLSLIGTQRFPSHIQENKCYFSDIVYISTSCLTLQSPEEVKEKTLGNSFRRPCLGNQSCKTSYQHHTLTARNL
jgi:hypothetical protein